MALAEIARRLPPLIAGAAVPYSPELLRLISQPPDYQKYGKKIWYNPPPELILEEINGVLKEKNLSFPIPGKKRDILNYFVAFTDQHTSPLHPSLLSFAPQCERLLRKIMNASLRFQRPITLPEQLKLATETFPDLNFVEIIIPLSLTSRAAARNCDSRIGIKVTEAEMEEWKTAVAPFGYNENTLDDPAGDTYHFWEAVLAGISVRAKRINGATFYEEITGRILEIIYRQTASLTNLIRYKIFKHEGTSHDTIDILGFEIGQAICF